MVPTKSLRKQMGCAAAVSVVIAVALAAGSLKAYFTLYSPPDGTAITLQLYRSLFAVTRTLIVIILPTVSAFCLFVAASILGWRRHISE